MPAFPQCRRARIYLRSVYKLNAGISMCVLHVNAIARTSNANLSGRFCVTFHLISTELETLHASSNSICPGSSYERRRETRRNVTLPARARQRVPWPSDRCNKKCISHGAPAPHRQMYVSCILSLVPLLSPAPWSHAPRRRSTALNDALLIVRQNSRHQHT